MSNRAAAATSRHRGPPYDRVCFDCDSTLCTIEGLDRLAERAGIATQLRPITAAAMNGDTDFDNAYAERLALLRPDQAAVDWLAEQYQSSITPGANELLRDCDRRVNRSISSAAVSCRRCCRWLPRSVYPSATFMR